MPVFSSDAALATAADMAACRSLLRDGSRSFLAASHLLPARVRDPAIALYAFCRIADDLVDLGQGSGTTLAALSDRLDRIYDRRPLPQPADRALTDVVAAFQLPRALLDGLLEGFAWDAAGRTYESFADLCDYAARVAGTVGAMMAMLMGQRAPSVIARACDLGIAMQLTNIARDVGEDARVGRLYLPRDWMTAAGVDPDAWLMNPTPSAALATVVRRLLDEAACLYTSAEAAIAALPADCRSGIWAARLLYADIGREVAQRGFDSVTGRARVGAKRKTVLLARAMAASMVRHREAVVTSAPCPATAFLVAAIPPAAAGMVSPVMASSPTAKGRFIWLLDLFERLERADRLQNASR